MAISNVDLERDVVAMRVMARISDTNLSGAIRHRDSEWVARKGGKVTGAAMTIGFLSSASTELRLRRSGTRVIGEKVSESTRGRRKPEVLEGEAAVLHGIAQQFERLSNPLLITFGGLSFDLPLLRYRCIAHAIPLPTIHLSLGDRLKYFEPTDSSWHLDILNALAGHGTTEHLELADLCNMSQVACPKGPADTFEGLAKESEALFALLPRFLRLSGRMNGQDFEAALRELPNPPPTG